MIRGVVFDKDGTLVDFHATWDPLLLGLIEGLADGDDELLVAAADAIDFDLGAGATRATSPIIAASNLELVALLAPVFGRPVGDPGFLDEVEAALLAQQPWAVGEVSGATAVLGALRDRGVALGLATNDSESSARAQLEHLGWTEYFAAVVGYDSGHGAKPAPGMVEACGRGMGLAMGEIAMVGDSLHDLHAARSAGVTSVLFGERDDLRDHADHVITELAGLLDLVDRAQSG